MRKFAANSILILLIVLLAPWVVRAEPPDRPADQDVLSVIESPLPNTEVRGRVQIKGTARHPQFDFYKVEFGPGENPNDSQMTIIGAIHKEQVTSNLLETWDTTGLADGTYTVRLRVVDVTGNYQEAWTRRLSVTNSLPTETPTPSLPTWTPLPSEPTETPTALPPTPTIVVEQPFLQATPLPTPPPLATTAGTLAPSPTPTPEVAGEQQDDDSILAIAGGLVDPRKLGNSLCYGALFMAGLFLLFGFLSGLRRAVLYLMNHQ